MAKFVWKVTFLLVVFWACGIGYLLFSLNTKVNNAMEKQTMGKQDMNKLIPHRYAKDETISVRPKEEPDNPDDERDKAIENVQMIETDQKLAIDNDHIMHLEPDMRSLPQPKDGGDKPGELGKAVLINKTELSVEERRIYDKGWKDHAFNLFVSDMISLHRSLPDGRDPLCKSVEYPDNMPDTSVVIIFNNEAWSPLLRTVHSVLDRSPPHLLKEIILVDDFSTHDYLQSQLEEYILKLEKVKLIRLSERQGLIGARLKGASAATAQVVTFMDSHCEAAEGWLEPLLIRISQNESHVVMPVITSINKESFAFADHADHVLQVGGFNWDMLFSWHLIPDRISKKLQTQIDPISSPTMAGGLFSISKAFFEKLGTYDPEMKIWGGENLELSFKIWMCGGSLELVPCSIVGHVFRKDNPHISGIYSKPLNVNRVRLVEVWLDEYKKYFYESTGINQTIEYGDIRPRKELRQQLHCKSFDWYMKNIYPELVIPGEALAAGQIQIQDRCLHGNVGSIFKDKKDNVQLIKCLSTRSTTYWLLNKDGEIRRGAYCLDYNGHYLMTNGCHGHKGHQEWVYASDNTIRHVVSGLQCLTASEDQTNLYLCPCSGSDSQRYIWERRIPDSENKKIV